MLQAAFRCFGAFWNVRALRCRVMRRGKARYSMHAWTRRLAHSHRTASRPAFSNKPLRPRSSTRSERRSMRLDVEMPRCRALSFQAEALVEELRPRLRSRSTGQGQSRAWRRLRLQAASGGKNSQAGLPNPPRFEVPEARNRL